jgi:poly-gamma-glutamate capsule biosynthesis protein CapA/YwtB (metallophosphatase superfamily)
MRWTAIAQHVIWSMAVLLREQEMKFLVERAPMAWLALAAGARAGVCLGVLFGLCFSLGACGEEPPDEGIVVEVVDEQGEPVSGAEIDVGVDVAVTGKSGRAVLAADLVQPALAVIRGDGILPEPLVIEGAAVGDVVAARVLSDGGGRRWVMHAAGDVMLARRYETPDQGEPLVPAADAAGGARRVVAAVQRAFGAADLRTLNLESVIGDVPDDAGYPGKAFLIRTRPEALAGLQELSVDLVGLANNHIRDFGDEGVVATMAALEQAGIAHVGAAAGTADDEQSAARPAVIEVGDVRVGMLAWSTLSGSAVNDGFPADGAPVPEGVDPEILWQYEARAWSFAGPTWSVPALPRRIGSVWRLFADIESKLDRAEAAAAWASLSEVYPEMQDWVAGRGHGGAASWQTQKAQQAITALAMEADVVVVQLHGGFDFQTAPSAFLRTAARAAVDAGADLVLAHHPHVLQGAEWYRGKLIAYSLGNFLFDQEFLLTFSSAFLRTVWDGDTLIEARLMPIEIDGYQPRPVAGVAARRAARAVWEKSVMGAVADRDAAGDVRTLLEDGASATEVQVAHVAMHQYGALLTKAAPDAETITIDVPGQSATPIGPTGPIGLVRVPADAGLLAGRSLFEWGHFEDLLADGDLRTSTHWAIEGEGKEVVLGPQAFQGQGYLRLRRRSGGSLPSFVRPVARIPMPEHRLYRAEAGVGVAVDGPARYTLRFAARLAGGGAPFVTLQLGHFDDGNPGEDPASSPVAEIELPIEIAADGQWHIIELNIPDEALTDGARRANTVMVYLRLGPPERGEAYFDVDELTLIEWRSAAAVSQRFAAWDFLSAEAGEQRVSLEVLPLSSMP